MLLIDASDAWLPRNKSLGAKRRDIPDGVERPENYLPFILDAFDRFEDCTIELPCCEPNETQEIWAKVFPTTAFGFRKVTIERPLRLNFQATEERIARVAESRAFQNLAVSRKKDADVRAQEEAAGRETQTAILEALGTLPDELCRVRDEFVAALDAALQRVGLKVTAAVKRAILDGLSERDPNAPICLDKDGNPEADTSLRDTESVPLDYLDDKNVPPERKVYEFFEREVQPHVEDAWINETVRDEKDGEVGIVGYEINFNRYFYRYEPPRELELIEADIKQVEQDVLRLLQEVAG